jgi:hypothetical protein
MVWDFIVENSSPLMELEAPRGIHKKLIPSRAALPSLHDLFRRKLLNFSTLSIFTFSINFFSNYAFFKKMLENRKVKKKYFEIPLSPYFLKSKKSFF